MLNVAFINPPFLPRFSRESRSAAVTKSNTLYYPHWLCYAAAATSSMEGVSVEVIDAAPEDVPVSEIVDRLRPLAPRLALFDTSTPSIYNDLRVADAIKKAIPECQVAVVGPHVTATVNETFQYCRDHELALDFVFHGEYETTTRQVVQCLQAGEDWCSVKGLAYQNGHGEVISNPEQEPIADLDSIPFVSSIYKRFLDIPKYFMSHTKYPMVTLISGRGCPFRCTFCQLPQVMYGHKWRARSVENFVDEVEYIVRELPEVRGIMLEDDTFTVDKRRVGAICREMIDRKITGIELTCNARADVDYETLSLMRTAGFRMMCVGFESGDQETLNRMRKGTEARRISGFVRDARAAKVKIHGCFMYGNREETAETMHRTLDFALALPIDTAQFYPIMLSPGTADYEYYKKAGRLITEDFSKWNDERGQHRSTVRREYLTEKEIEDFCDFSRRRFYLRPKYVWLKAKEAFLSLDHLKKNLRGFRVLVTHLLSRPGRGLGYDGSRPGASKNAI